MSIQVNMRKIYSNNGGKWLKIVCDLEIDLYMRE